MFSLRGLLSRRVLLIAILGGAALYAVVNFQHVFLRRVPAHVSLSTSPTVKTDVSSAEKVDARRLSVESDASSGVKSDTSGSSDKTDGTSGMKTDVISGVKNETNGSVKGDGNSEAKPSIEVKPTDLCPDKPPIKETKVPLNLSEITYDQLKREFSHVLQKGGRYSPSTCIARERLALIIPYRDRERNLHILLHNLIPFLIRQQIEFTVFVVEQTKDFLFNRCLMFNVGFVESQKQGDFTCFIVQDTDLIPRDFRNLYRCSSRPRHLVLIRSNEHFEEKLPYRSFIGGALALRREHMEKSNGCSNSYYGWGLEDDDLEIRLKSHGFPVVRYAMDIGGYYSLGHAKQTDNTARGRLVKTIRSRMDKEGLNTLSYTLVDQQQRELYTWLLVKPPPPPADIYTDN